MSLEEKRQRVEESLQSFRKSADSELGWFPKGSGWLLGITAFAVGLRLAASRLRNRKSEKP